MTEKQTWDVIVVGSGPAGSTAAEAIAHKGARTLLLEKSSHPRYKACGGGVPIRTMAMLPLRIDSVIETHIDTVEVSHFGKRTFTKTSPSPIAAMVMRDRFDALLLDRATYSGAIVRQGEAVIAVENKTDYAIVSTTRGEYQARWVIGADGATGIVARSSGLLKEPIQSAAWEIEISASAHFIDHWRGRANIDIGYKPWGYGWVFPKNASLSIGLVTSPGSGKQIKKLGNEYINRLGLTDAHIIQAKGHPIRFRRGKHPITSGNIILIGDAAGLADEFTAEGIGYAIHSGQLAAKAILNDSSSGEHATITYEESVNREIQTELDSARAISRMYYSCVTSWPWLAMSISKRLDYFWYAFFRIMRGESSYETELSRVPGLSLSKKIL